MTTSAIAQSEAQSGSRAVSAWRRHRASLFVAVGLLAALGLAVVFGTGVRTATPMDPDNPGPNGTRALAQVLGDEGVEIAVARGANQFEETGTGPGSTVVAVLPDHLGISTIERLLDHARDADRIVVVGAGPAVTRAFDVSSGGAQARLDEDRLADCDDPGDAATYDDLRLAVDSAKVYDGRGCFGAADGSVLVSPRPGLVLFGADQALTNDQILRADNAAVALRLIGADERLVWYVADPADLVGDDGVALRTLLPGWIEPSLMIALIAMGAVVLWRGRRLGALATEPLPVVVRASETTLSLGRLYRRAGDRGHAAEALRAAARIRCAERLGLATSCPAQEIVAEVARGTGRRADDVASLIGPAGDVPSSDSALITLAGRLAELDREVRRP